MAVEVRMRALEMKLERTTVRMAKEVRMRALYKISL